MSAVPLKRQLHFRAPACKTTAAPCDGCSCGKAGLSESVWPLHQLSDDCATRSSPCSSECTCERFQPTAELAFKAEPCAAASGPCDGCSCGKAALS